MSETVTDKLWLRVWRYPLVALVVAVAVTILSGAALSYLLRQLPDRVTDGWGGALPVVAQVAVLFALYKLVIRRLGDRKHDDLPLAGAGKGLLLGVGGGSLIIAVVVGIAALAGCTGSSGGRLATTSG